MVGRKRAVEARQAHRQIEAEAVDANALGPVAQRVHRKRDVVRVREVDRVAAAGRVFQFTGVLLLAAVERKVVEPAPTHARARVAAFARVVEHHVHDHFEPGFVQRAHHHDHFVAHGVRALFLRGACGVARFGCEETERRVTPVVRPAVLLQKDLGLFGHDRQQLDRRDAQTLQVRKRGGMRQARVCAAQFLGQPRRVRGEPLHMQLVDHRLAPWHMRVRGVGVVLGHITVVDRDRHRHFAQRIQPVHRTPRRSLHMAFGVDLTLVRERGRVQAHPALHALRIRVDQKLIRVEPQPMFRVPRALSTVAVMHAVPRLRQVQIPQAVIRTVHTEQGLAHAQSAHHTRADPVLLHRLNELRAVGIIVDPHGVVVERARHVERLQYTEPKLFGGL